MGQEEQREPTEEEREQIGKAKEFVDSLSKEMDGKITADILPLDVAMIVSVCLARLYESNPLSFMIKHELMHIVTLVANSVLKYQEKKLKENTALEKLWKED